MGYSAVWKILDKMTKDLKKKGAEIPPDVISNLKSAKTLLAVSKAECINGESLQKIVGYLENVEADLVSEAQKRFGDDYADDWLRKIDTASKEKPEEVVEDETRFVPSVPRGQRWIRVQPSKDLSNVKLADLAEELGLSCAIQKDGCMLVYGKEEQLMQFVKRMTFARRSKTHLSDRRFIHNS